MLSLHKIHADTELKTVPYLDLKRFMGDWHVIANIPNFVEKDCIASVDSYALRPDGKIDNWFVGKKRDGSEVRLTALAWVHDPKTQSEWQVRFNWDTFLGRIPIPIHFAYDVIDLDTENYSYTVVGHPNRNLVWIMARTPSIDDQLYSQLISRIREQGFDPKKVVRLPGLKAGNVNGAR